MNSNSGFGAVDKLDLGAIKLKLMHVESGEGWTAEHADAVECEYRRFLYLAGKHPHEQIAPLSDVDIFWHYHILDTMKYAADCEAVFGYFLHHFPYIGLRGDDDIENHRQIGQRTRELSEQTFRNVDASHATAYCAVTARSLDQAIGKRAYCAATAATAYCAAAEEKVSYCAATQGKESYCAATQARQSYRATQTAPSRDRAANNSAYCAATTAQLRCANPRQAASMRTQ